MTSLRDWTQLSWAYTISLMKCSTFNQTNEPVSSWCWPECKCDSVCFCNCQKPFPSKFVTPTTREESSTDSKHCGRWIQQQQSYKPIFYISYSIYECVFLIWIMCPAADCILITGGNGVKRVLVTFSPTFTIVLWNMTLLQCFFLFIPEIDWYCYAQRLRVKHSVCTKRMFFL